MFHLEDVIHIKSEEQLKTIARKHIATLFPKLCLAFLLIVGPFFFLFPLFRWGVLGVILFCVVLSAGIFFGMRSLLLWDADVLIVTTVRVVDVDQRGIFTRMVSEIPLHSVRDISWAQRGVWESLFRMGTVRLQTSSGSVTIEAKRIPHPQDVQRMISELAQATQSSSRADSRQLERIIAILQTYSSDELARIETVLQARTISPPDSASAT